MSEAQAPSPTALQVAVHTTRRVAVAVAVVALAGAAIFGGYRLWRGVTPYERTDNAYVKGDLTFVATKVPGYVVAIETENNQRVRPGQVLARIDPRDFEAARRDGQALVAQQKAAIQQLQAQESLQRAQIEVAQAGVAAARAQARKTSADFTRAKALVVTGAVSRSLYDQAQSDDAKAQAALAQASAQALYAQRQQDVIAAQRLAAQANLQSGEAKLYKADNDLAASVLTAPREGLVAARNVRLGEYVAVGTRLLAIAPTHGLWVEANLRETQISRIRRGDRVELRVDAARDQVYCGVVDGVAGASGSEFSVIPPDNATGNFTKVVRRFPVRILLDADQPGLDRLGAGMSVEPTIALGSHDRQGGGRGKGFRCGQDRSAS